MRDLAELLNLIGGIAPAQGRLNQGVGGGNAMPQPQGMQRRPQGGGMPLAPPPMIGSPMPVQSGPPQIGAPAPVPANLRQQMVGAQQDMYRAQNPEGAFSALLRQTRMPKAIESMAMAEANAQEYARAQGAKTSQDIADSVYAIAMDLTGDDETARNIATLSLYKPDEAKKMLEQIGEDQLKTRTAVQQDAIAMGLEPGTPEYNQYVRDATISKAGNIYNVPAGYRWKGGQVGGELEVVPGGPADQEQEAARIAAQRNWRNTYWGAQNVIDMAKEALELNGISTTGPIGQILANIPGTDAANMQRILDSLKANTGFDRLQQMRQASITGGALGNVSNREIELLYNSLAPLGGENSPQMSPAQMARSLQTIIASYSRLAEYAKDPTKFDNMSDEEYYDYWSDKGLPPEMYTAATEAKLKGKEVSGYVPPADVAELQKKYQGGD